MQSQSNHIVCIVIILIMEKAPTTQYIPKSDTTVNNLKSSVQNLKAFPKPLRAKLLEQN